MIERLVLLTLLIISNQARLWPAEPDAPETDAEPLIETPIDQYDREHWAFQKITRPEIPSVQNPAWPRTQIDHFILKRLEEESLTPAGETDRGTLIRRLCFDLTGLPPTPRQLSTFIEDDSPDAYRRLVDSLLASPEYGRRWGQYWLDLARFAETDGYEHDKIRPTAWQYRDWVVQSLNDDMPYDQFLGWQIAGDVLAPAAQVDQGRIATAFCLSGPDMPDINSQAERKHLLMNEITSTIGSVFLSLQIGCAQCHDHMYDAISQADFYRLRAFFEPAVRLHKDQSVTTLQPDADPAAESRLMIRGDWRRQGPRLVAAFPRIANLSESTVEPSDPGQRRAQLAKWLTAPQHPLTARSIVNRIWQHHFGRGLSVTPSDFGVVGNEPSHPELLDHLASQLIDQQWSLKRLHRQIALSAVYRMCSTQSERSDDAATNAPSEASRQWRKSIEADLQNRWLSRFPRRRLDAEALRDAMFAVSGALNHHAGGPGVRPPLPPELINTLLPGQWNASPNQADHYRRSIYIFARRNLRYPFFATFDRPGADSSCEARQNSTTAVQSLLLFNSTITINAAELLAEEIARVAPEHHRQQCIDIYQRLFSRNPARIELDDCIAFLKQQATMLRNEGFEEAEAIAKIDLCRALLNASQFMYVD